MGGNHEHSHFQVVLGLSSAPDCLDLLFGHLSARAHIHCPSEYCIYGGTLFSGVGGRVVGSFGPLACDVSAHFQMVRENGSDQTANCQLLCEDRLGHPIRVHVYPSHADPFKEQQCPHHSCWVLLAPSNIPERLPQQETAAARIQLPARHPVLRLSLHPVRAMHVV